MIRLPSIQQTHDITLAAALAREGVLVLPFGEDVRLVTHHEITENAIEITLKAFYSVLSGASRGP